MLLLYYYLLFIILAVVFNQVNVKKYESWAIRSIKIVSSFQFYIITIELVTEIIVNNINNIRIDWKDEWTAL